MRDSTSEGHRVKSRKSLCFVVWGLGETGMECVGLGGIWSQSKVTFECGLLVSPLSK